MSTGVSFAIIAIVDIKLIFSVTSKKTRPHSLRPCGWLPNIPSVVCSFIYTKVALIRLTPKPASFITDEDETYIHPTGSNGAKIENPY